MKLKIFYGVLIGMCALYSTVNISAQSASPTPEYIFFKTPGVPAVGSSLGTIYFRSRNANNNIVDGALIKSMVTQTPQGTVPANFEFHTGIQELKNRFQINDNGLIGINTNKPGALLTINQFGNDVQTLKIFEVIGGGVSNQKTLQLFSENNQLNADLQGHFLLREGNFTLSDGHLSIAKGNATLSIGNLNLNKGNVLLREGTLAIGTGGDPLRGSHKLYVNGSIVATQVKIEYYNNWPDYVFEPTYKIDLDSIENFIAKNKHLPGLPSAKEVLENGFELGEMQKLLLEKIEELTLIVIEQKKEIENLKLAKH